MIKCPLRVQNGTASDHSQRVLPYDDYRREKSKSLEVVANSLQNANHSKYPWLEWDKNTMSGKFLNMPERSDIPENIKEQLIVDLYSK